MTTGRVDGFLELLNRYHVDIPKRLRAQTEEVRSGREHLERALDNALLSVEVHATGRQAQAAESLDVERVRSLVLSGRDSELSPREARYAMVLFLEFPVQGIEQLLESRPALWRTFARQLLLRWETALTHPDWNSYAEIVERMPASLSPVAASVSLSTIVRQEGAWVAAGSVEVRSLGELHRLLVEDWRLQPTWSLTPHILVEWIRRSGREREGLIDSVRELVDPGSEALRALLLPAPALSNSVRGVSPARLPIQKAVAHGSLAVQIRAVAALLTGRFPAAAALDESTFAALEPLLLRSTFGDPRIANVSGAWAKVRTLVPESYDAFLQSLVREDIALFFRYVMREEDRERFWLRYLGSIRRTLCVLDPDAFRSLEQKLAGAEERTRAALGRVVRTPSRQVDGTSAFCLYFDQVVMVEFSNSGNAGYLYDRHIFERDLLKSIQQGTVTSPASLKDREKKNFRLVHRGDWQPKMERELMSHRIRPDARLNRSAAHRA